VVPLVDDLAGNGSGARVLVTGAAGFIGMHAAAALAARGVDVVGVDDFNGYYSVELKRARAAELMRGHGLRVAEADVCDRPRMAALLRSFKGGALATHVLHLAAQPGVRYSVRHPETYVRSNVGCFVELLEAVLQATAEAATEAAAKTTEDGTADDGPSGQASSRASSRASSQAQAQEDSWTIPTTPALPYQLPYQLPYLVYASSSSVYGLNAKVPFSEQDPVDRPANL